MDKHIYISQCVICYIVIALSTGNGREINVASTENGGTCKSTFTGQSAYCGLLIDGMEAGSAYKWSTTEDIIGKTIDLYFNDIFYLTKMVFVLAYYEDERSIKTALLSFSDGSSTKVTLTNRLTGSRENDTFQIDRISHFVKITIESVYSYPEAGDFKAMYEVKVFGLEVTTSTTATTTTTTSQTTTSTSTKKTPISSSTSTTNTPTTEINSPQTSAQPKPISSTTSLLRNDSAFTKDNQEQVSNDNIKPISIGVIVFLIAIIVIQAAIFTFVFIKQRRKISSLNAQLKGKAVYENDPTRNVQPSTYEDVSTVSKYGATAGPTEYERMEHIHPSQRPLPGIYADLK